MAISRSQIPSQIDPFATGGDVSEKPAFSLDNLNELATLLRESGQSDYDANVTKYKERLGTVRQAPRKMNIYDVASDLGAGILSTPNVGGISFAQGLGSGFSRISDRMRSFEEEQRQFDQQVSMQAVQMANQDEKSALEFARQIDMKQAELKNKQGKKLYFQMIDEDGNKIIKTVRDNIAFDDDIQALLEQGYAPIDESAAITNVNIGGDGERDKQMIKKQLDAEDEAREKFRSAVGSIANIDEALAIAMKLGPTNFGAIAKLSLYPRQLKSAFGLTDMTEEEILGNQILLSQISMGFTMDIVSRTKGAISNKEMELFISASPGLGSNYNGFMKQAEYLRRIADRDKRFFTEYNKKAAELEGNSKLSSSQVYRQLQNWEADWYNDNLIFNADETAELKAIADGSYKDSQGMEYVIPEGFDVESYQKEYRQKQDEVIPSSFSLTAEDENALSVIRNIENSNIPEDEKKRKKETVYAQFPNLRGK
jgi:hypothetical protein